MREQRKVVTVLFADVVGSTTLAAQSDPEVVRSVMARYFQRIVDVSQAYGGTVEKFAGDAAMVVFGGLRSTTMTPNARLERPSRSGTGLGTYLCEWESTPARPLPPPVRIVSSWSVAMPSTLRPACSRELNLARSSSVT